MATLKNKPAGKERATLDEMMRDTFVFPKAFFIEPGTKNHLLEDYLPGPGSVSLIVAKPGIGKTTLIADFVFTYAYKDRYESLGSVEINDEANDKKHQLPLITYGDFLGQRITQRPRPVLYMALEGHRQLQLLGAAYTKEQTHFIEFELDKKKHRMKSKKQLHLTDELYFEPVVFLKDGNTPKFDNDVQYQELLARIDGLMQFFRNKNHAAPGIIVIDTGSRILEGEENSNTIISKVMNRCAELARTCKASVLILHHTSRSKNDPRGGSAWEGAADCVWLLSGSAKTGVTLNVQKFKGFILPPDLYFKVVPVETEFLDMDHTDGRKLMAARIERLMEKPAGSSKDKDAIGEKSAANLTRTPEQKHAKRQAERLDVLVCVWEDYCAKDLRNERPYITRSALGEYLSNVLGYKTGTINQAMKPSADSTKSASIIGPLLTDKLIEPCEHGWIILPTEAEQKATPPGEPRALPKRKVAKRKP